MNVHTLVIPTGESPPGEYLNDLHFGVTQTIKMALSAESLNLTKNDTEALYTMTDFAQKLVKRE